MVVLNRVSWLKRKLRDGYKIATFVHANQSTRVVTFRFIVAHYEWLDAELQFGTLKMLDHLYELGMGGCFHLADRGHRHSAGASDVRFYVTMRGKGQASTVVDGGVPPPGSVTQPNLAPAGNLAHEHAQDAPQEPTREFTSNVSGKAPLRGDTHTPRWVLPDRISYFGSGRGNSRPRSRSELADPDISVRRQLLHDSVQSALVAHDAANAILHRYVDADDETLNREVIIDSSVATENVLAAQQTALQDHVRTFGPIPGEGPSFPRNF